MTDRTAAEDRPAQTTEAGAPGQDQPPPDTHPDAPPAAAFWRQETADAAFWRQETAARFAVLVDGAAYFAALRAAMLTARQQILLIGWDFDARLPLPRAPDEARVQQDGQQGGPGDRQKGAAPERVGALIEWLAQTRPGLDIRLLRWDLGALTSLFRGNTLWTILRWKLHPRITLKLDSAHPAAGSQHQKIVVIDDRIAFCGGIDITAGRFDSRDHRDNDPARRVPDGRDHPPWHDAISVFDGAAARAMGDLARARWLAATGRRLPAPDLPKPDQPKPDLPTLDLPKPDLPTPDAAAPAPAPDGWPPGLAPLLTEARVAIARTQPAWAGTPAVQEVEAAYLQAIAGAKRHIYAESQYFASRRIARAIAARLAGNAPPEVVVINPRRAEGWLEPLAMDTARARLVAAIRGIDHHDRFRIWHPVTAGGADIYVHAKVMIVDDRLLRVGSSNLNNRSLGLDSECDVLVAAEGPTAAAAILHQRDDLLAEHLGVAPAEVAAAVAQAGSLIAAIEGLCRPPGQGARTLVPYRMPQLTSLGAWLAENQILDPASPDEVFEAPSRRHLFRGWSRLRGWAARRRTQRLGRRQDTGGGPER